jgi:hypothetical protein
MDELREAAEQAAHLAEKLRRTENAQRDPRLRDALSALVLSAETIGLALRGLMLAAAREEADVPRCSEFGAPAKLVN